MIKPSRLSEVRLTYAAQAVHPDLGNEGAHPGRISIARGFLRFEAEQLRVEIPLARLRMDFAGDDFSEFRISDSARPGWTILCEDEALLDDEGLSAVPAVMERLSSQASRHELKRRLRICGWVLGSGVFLALMISLAVHWMVAAVLARIPAEAERRFGDELIEEARAQLQFSEDTNRVARLAVLAEPLMRVIPSGKEGFTFHIVETEIPNAFALPGGHVLVTTGLLGLVQTREELVGVIAHEVAHVTRKHGFREIISKTSVWLVFQVFMGGGRGVSGMLSGGSGLLLEQGFSQEYEYEADAVGWDYLKQARIDPRGLADALLKLQSYYEAHGLTAGIPQAFQSHPAVAARVARLDKRWRKLEPKTGFIELK